MNNTLYIMAEQYQDRVYGPTELSDLQSDLLNTDDMRATAKVNQLGLASLVYKSANHARLEHMIGASILATKFANKLGFGDNETKIIQAAAQLHDIKHLPWSHAAQKYFESKRMEHEDLARKLITNPGGELFQILSDHKLDPELIADLIGLKTFNEKYNNSTRYLKQLISGDMDVDRLDYLQRDAMSAAHYGRGIDVDRLIQCAFIERNTIVYPLEARDAIYSFFGAYNNMHGSVYYNNKVQALETMLTKALFLKDDLLPQDKFDTITEFELEELLKDKTRDTTNAHRQGTKIAKRIFSTKPYKDAYIIENTLFSEDEYQSIQYALNAAPKDKLLDYLTSKITFLDGEILVLDNYKKPKPLETPDLYINSASRFMIPAHQVFDLHSFGKHNRHRNVLRVIGENKYHDQIKEAMLELGK